MDIARHSPLADLLRSFALMIIVVLVASCRIAQHAPALSLPSRAANAPGGTAFAQRIESLNLTNREQEILSQIKAGNVPHFLQTLTPVTFTNKLAGKPVTVTCFVTPDYLAVGSD